MNKQDREDAKTTYVRERPILEFRISEADEQKELGSDSMMTLGCEGGKENRNQIPGAGLPG